MDISNETDFKRLENCVTIEGSLAFLWFTYNNISFPNLLYIKGGLSIHNIDSLTSVRQLLPNLVHIQGKTWRISLEIFQNKDLEELGFKKLMKIDSGYVRIVGNPRFCFSDMINWPPYQDSENRIEVRSFKILFKFLMFKFLRFNAKIAKVVPSTKCYFDQNVLKNVLKII